MPEDEALQVKDGAEEKKENGKIVMKKKSIDDLVSKPKEQTLPG